MKNKINIILYMLLLFPFLYSGSLFNDSLLLVKIWKIGAAIILTFLTFKDYKRIKINKITFIIIIFALYQFINSLLNSTLSSGIFFTIYFMAISILFLQRELYEDNFNFLFALCIIHNILLVLNIPSLISQINVDEYNRQFFLGGKNALCMFTVPTIFYNYLYYNLTKKKMTISCIFIIILAIITPMIGGSSTGTVVSILMMLFIMIGEKIRFNPIIMYIVYIIILIVILNPLIISNIGFLNNLITDILNKDLTFTGRTEIWDVTTNLIVHNLFGYGRGNTVLSSYLLHVDEAHNIFLQLLLDGGIVSLVVFVYYFLTCVFTKNRNKFNYKIINITQITIFSLFLIGLTESMTYKLDLWIIMLILYFFKTKNKELKNEKEY